MTISVDSGNTPQYIQSMSNDTVQESSTAIENFTTCLVCLIKSDSLEVDGSWMLSGVIEKTIDLKLFANAVEFGQYLGVGRPLVQRWVDGETSPTRPMRVAIYRALVALIECPIHLRDL